MEFYKQRQKQILGARVSQDSGDDTL